MTDTERILEKVRRLLALATSSNIHEAEAAAAKAQELLIKYNLEMADVPDDRKEDIERFVFATGHAVYKTIDKLADREWKAYAGYARSARMFKTSFRYGACNGIGEKLKEERERAMQADVKTNALIVVSDQAVAARVKEFYPRLRTTRYNPNHSGAYYAGQEAGRGINIRQGVGAGAGTRRQIG